VRPEGRDGQIRTLKDTPFTLSSVGVMHPSWGWSWLRVGATGKRFVKMNIRVRNRNATTLI
jgi:hypothetical protein